MSIDKDNKTSTMGMILSISGISFYDFTIEISQKSFILIVIIVHSSIPWTSLLSLANARLYLYLTYSNISPFDFIFKK